jgi:hypothetical protein
VASEFSTISIFTFRDPPAIMVAGRPGADQSTVEGLKLPESMG